MIRLRAEVVSTSHSLPLPPPIILSHTRTAAPSSGTPPLHLFSTDRREDRPEVTLPPRKRLGIALGPRYEIGESSSTAARPAGGLRADYGFVSTMDREIRHDLERDVGYGITDSWNEIVEAMQGTPVVMSLRTTVLAQQSQIRELQSADHRRQTMITEMLVVDHRRQKQLTEAMRLIKRLLTQMTEFERQ
ncbi:hypothetical protein Tco_1343359 [Tanacetum coccineum]